MQANGQPGHRRKLRRSHSEDLPLHPNLGLRAVDVDRASLTTTYRSVYLEVYVEPATFLVRCCVPQ